MFLSPEVYKLVLSPNLAMPQAAGLESFINSYFNLSLDEIDTLIDTEDINVKLGNLPMYIGKGRNRAGGDVQDRPAREVQQEQT